MELRRGKPPCSQFPPMQNLIAKAATLLEALPYIQKFSGETFVVKYGGSFMDSPDPAVRNGVAHGNRLASLLAVEFP